MMDDPENPAGPAVEPTCPEPPQPETPPAKQPRPRKKSRQQRLRALRERLLVKQKHRCVYCGCDMITTPHQPNSATLDHVVPRAHGGTNIRANLVVACMRCNTTRKHHLIDPIRHARALAAITADKARRAAETHPHKCGGQGGAELPATST